MATLQKFIMESFASISPAIYLNATVNGLLRVIKDAHHSPERFVIQDIRCVLNALYTIYRCVNPGCIGLTQYVKQRYVIYRMS